MFKKTTKNIFVRLLIVVYVFTLIPNYNKVYAALGAPSIVSPSNGSSIDKGDIKVSWTSVTGANSYIMAVRDLTTDTKIIDTNVGNTTSYIISSYMLIENHQYRIAVGARDASGNESWDANTYVTITIKQKKADITPPVINNLMGYIEVEKGKSTNLVGIISSNTNLTKVTVNVLNDYTGDYYTRNLSGVKSFDLSQVKINTTSGTFSKAGIYTVRIWANSEGYTSTDMPIGTVTVVVKEIMDTTPPVINNLMGYIEVEKGKSTNLVGIISSNTNLTKVTVNVLNDYAGDYYTRNLSGVKSFDLSQVKINTTSGTFSKAGIYTVRIWANSEGYTSTDTPIGTVTVVVKEIMDTTPPVINNLMGYIEVEKGKSTNLVGIISSNTNLTKVTVNVLNDYTGDYYTRNLSGVKSFDLSQVKINTTSGTFSKAGIYTVRIWANSEGYTSTDMPIGTVTVVVKEIMDTTPPVINNLMGYIEVEKGKSTNLVGIISSNTNLTKVTVNVLNDYTGDYYTKSLSGVKSFDLSQVKINTTSGTFSKAGVYTVRIWANSEGYTSTDTPIGTVTVVVKEIMDTTIKQLQSLKSNISKLTVEQGKSIKFVDNVKITGIYSDGSSEDLTYQAGNNCNIANKAIATVGSGYIKGVKVGTTRLTCSYSGKSVSITIVVTVAAKKKLEEPVIINPSDYQISMNKDLIIEWKPVNGAKYYKVKIRDITINAINGPIILPETKTTATKIIINKNKLKEDHKYRIWVGSYESTGNVNLSGNTEKEVVVLGIQKNGLPKEYKVLPGELKPLLGTIVTEDKISTVKIKMKRQNNDFNIKIDEPFTANNVNANTFNLSRFSFSATGEEYSIPGKYIATVYVTTEDNNTFPYGEFTIEVLEPFVYKEVRYLPEEDSVYLRADLNPIIGQKNQNEWRNVWVGVYDTTKEEWLYKVPDINNLMTHVGTNTYEMYFTAQKLVRLDNLKFVFFVDGYTVYDSIINIKGDVLSLTPVPYYSWLTRYNWKTDELEVLVMPDILNQDMSRMPKLYAVIYDDDYSKELYVNFDAYTEIPLYGGDVEDYKGKYFRSWKLDKLNLQKDKTYKIGVKAIGYENQWNMNLIKSVAVYKPTINSFNIKYDSKQKNIIVKVSLMSVKEMDNVQLCVDNTNIAVNLNKKYFSDYNPNITASSVLNIDKLGLSIDKGYNFYLKLLDSSGILIEKTDNQYVLINDYVRNTNIDNSIINSNLGIYSSVDINQNKINYQTINNVFSKFQSFIKEYEVYQIIDDAKSIIDCKDYIELASNALESQEIIKIKAISKLEKLMKIDFIKNNKNNYNALNTLKIQLNNELNNIRISKSRVEKFNKYLNESKIKIASGKSIKSGELLSGIGYLLDSFKISFKSIDYIGKLNQGQDDPELRNEIVIDSCVYSLAFILESYKILGVSASIPFGITLAVGALLYETKDTLNQKDREYLQKIYEMSNNVNNDYKQIRELALIDGLNGKKDHYGFLATAANYRRLVLESLNSMPKYLWYNIDIISKDASAFKNAFNDFQSRLMNEQQIYDTQLKQYNEYYEKGLKLREASK